MDGRRGNRDPFFDFGDPFAGFEPFLGGHGGHQNLISGFFGGRNPFDDRFFRQPFGGMFDSNFSGPTGSPLMNMNPAGFSTGSHLMNGYPSGFFTGNPSINGQHSSQTNRSRGPVIEELNSEDEKEVKGKKDKKDNPRKHGRSRKGPSVEHPDHPTEERKSKQNQYWNEHNSVNNAQLHPQTHSVTFESSYATTYGGSNGPYYTSSRTLRTGSDGLTIDEAKEADSTTGRAAHRILRGIHDKGHTITRNLQSDGRVDTRQILHNINEGDLAGFEEAWNENARNRLPGWSDGFNVQNGSGSSSYIGQQSRGSWALPSYYGEEGANSSHLQHSGGMRANSGERTGSSRGRSRAFPHQ